MRHGQRKQIPEAQKHEARAQTPQKRDRREYGVRQVCRRKDGGRGDSRPFAPRQQAKEAKQVLVETWGSTTAEVLGRLRRTEHADPLAEDEWFSLSQQAEKAIAEALHGPPEIRTPHDDTLLIMPSLRASRGHTAVRMARFV